MPLYCMITRVTFLLPGYGFVDFESVSEAEIALKALQAQGVQGKMAKVCLVLIFQAMVL